jgi:multiple sugar transport system ATP-binding protein
MSSGLVLANVDKIYPGRRGKPVHAVKDLSLTVKPGEITALLGSSGCGKTSTLRMIAGFEEATGGSIMLDGTAIHNLPPARRRVAMAFEAYSLYPPLTIGENIAFALKSSRLSAPDRTERVRQIAEMLEISDIIERYPTSVSGGQQQRASLGRALVRPAGLYLLDEPMGQLEPQLRSILRGRIKHFLREHGCTTILVTHDQTEANAIADRIAVMEDGVLQQYATPAELKERPANMFVGTFIGEPPMNVFPAKLRKVNGRLDFVIDDDAVLSYGAKDFPAAVAMLAEERNDLTLGARPHALRIAASGLKGKVVSCQWLGDQTHLAVEIGGRLAVSVAHERIKAPAGSEIAFSIASGDLHVFESGDGRALAHGGMPA